MSKATSSAAAASSPAPPPQQQQHKFVESSALRTRVATFKTSKKERGGIWASRFDPHSILNENFAMLRGPFKTKVVGQQQEEAVTVRLFGDPSVKPAELFVASPEPPQQPGDGNTSPRFAVTEWCVVNADTVSAALSLLAQHDHGKDDNNSFFSSDQIAALNFANAEVPGGYYKSGSGVKAQEESICRVLPQLFASLEMAKDTVKGAYPIPVGGALISRNIAAVRNPSEEHGPICLSVEMNDGDTLDFSASPGLGQFIVVSAAAPRGAMDRRPTGGFTISSSWGVDFVLRVRGVLNAAKQAGCTALILGAWGCGAFGGRPQPTASVFKEVLMSSEFRGCFRAVVFAIVDPMQTGNLKPFAAGLEGLK